MCEICKKHGDGNKWYFNPKNYSKELEGARIDYLEKLAGRTLSDYLISGYEFSENVSKIPLLGKLLNKAFDKNNERTLGGQIVPLNDFLEVLELCENPALLPCECRMMIGKEKYCCLNMGLLPELYQKANPDEYIEEVSVNKAQKLATEWDKKGFYHLLLWTKLPYVTTVCSCTAPICTAYKGRNFLGLKNNMLKGEYIARVNPQKCTGCKICLTRCQFGAIHFNFEEEQAFIDINRCFGCGLCETGCNVGAIELIDRMLTPAKKLW